MNDSSKIYEKLDAIEFRLADMDKQLAIYNEQLKIHIEGTVQNRNSIKQIEKHVHMVEGGLKLLGLVSLITGIVAAITSVL